MAYALNARKDNIIMTLDTGHFHPTEVVSAKLGALYAFVDHILLHVSRPVRWDSDHVVSFDDETRAIMEELVRLNRLQDTYIATDFFDASINRICAWTIGLRNTRKAMLAALLQPVDKMKELEATGDVSARLAFKEEFKAAPFSLVGYYYCAQQNAGVSLNWLEEVKAYEAEILKVRS